MVRDSPDHSHLPPHERYLLALGRFIQRYSSMEAQLHTLLQREAAVSAEKAAALFSGTRVSDATSFIKRLHEARGEEPHWLLKHAFAHIGTLTAVRNDVVHYGANFEKGVPKFVSNKRVAKLAKRAQWYPISFEMLDDMSADIDRVASQLQLFIQYRNLPPDRFEESAKWAARDPWRYKHVPQAGTRPPPLTTDPTP